MKNKFLTSAAAIIALSAASMSIAQTATTPGGPGGHHGSAARGAPSGIPAVVRHDGNLDHPHPSPEQRAAHDAQKKAQLAQAVASGRLTQEQANRIETEGPRPEGPRPDGARPPRRD